MAESLLNTGEKEQKEKMLLLLITGVLFALKTQVITDDDAQRLVFSPHLISMLKKNKFDENILEILSIGLELEDILEFKLNYYLEVDGMIEKCLSLISKSNKINPNLNRWYMENFILKDN